MSGGPLKLLFLICFVCVLVCFDVVGSQANCAQYGSCLTCTDKVCTWCSDSNRCILVTEQCEKTDPSCKTVMKRHTYLIGIAVGVYLVMVAVMLMSIKTFFFPRRSRILARHARRRDVTDLNAFDSYAKELARSIKEPLLWCDVSLSRIWFAFGICVTILILGLPFPILFIAGTYSVAGWVVGTVLPLIPSIAFVFYLTTNKSQYSKVNALTHTGAYVVTPFLKTQTFVAYSSMSNVTVTESRGGLGNVMFYGGGKSAVGFFNIPAPHAAVKLINDKLDALPTFSQSPTRVEMLSPYSEDAPLLSGGGGGGGGGSISPSSPVLR